MSINKKKFQLKSYSSTFEKSMEKHSIIFFFSRFGKFRQIKTAQVRTKLRNLNVKLMRKLITNDMFSGSSYLLASRVNFNDTAISEIILESLSGYQFFLDTIKSENFNFKLQSVSFGRFYISSHMFLSFYNILQSRVISKFVLRPRSITVVSTLFVPFFYVLLLGMLKVLFQPVKNLFSLKNLINNKIDDGNS